MAPLLATDLAVLAQVLLIDLALAGDNAVVIGLAVAPLRAELRRRAVWLGVGLAAVVRLALALVALRLLAIVGLTLAGGILLLWVAWKMWRELRRPAAHAGGGGAGLGGALLRIALADLSMSLDNVLAVAGAAHEHPWILAGGLGLSVVAMGLAAGAIAALLARYRWIAWAGLAMVVYVALHMIVQGWGELAGRLG